MVRLATEEDLDFLEANDKHISRPVILDKIRRAEVLVIGDDSELLGLARFNLFWDLVPFLTYIQILEGQRREGLGKQLMLFWEQAMRAQGHTLLLTSTQSDEDAQFFYRKLGYQDAGVLLLPGEPGELFMMKTLG